MLSTLTTFYSGIDISPMDAGNVLAGICSLAYDRLWCFFKRTRYFLIDYFAAVLRGVTVFPFLIFFLATLNSSLMEILLNGNRTVLMLASIIGLVTVWNSDKWVKDKLGSAIEARRNLNSAT